MRYLIGPEVLWLVYYGAATLLVRFGNPHSKPLSYFIQTSWFWIPVLALPLFSLWWFPEVNKDWLLLRVWVASILGGHYTLYKIINASPIQNSGTGMGYLAGMIFLIVFLMAGSIGMALKQYLS